MAEKIIPLPWRMRSCIWKVRSGSFFREPACDFHVINQRSIRNPYTTNALNGNILLQDTHLKLPKMSVIRIKLHRQIPSDWKLKSVTVSREPSGKYILPAFCSAVRTKQWKKDRQRILGMDLAMQGMCVFSTGERAGYPMFYRKAREKTCKRTEKAFHCEKESRNYQKQKKRVALCHEKIKRTRKKISSISSAGSLRKDMMQYVWKI